MKLVCGYNDSAVHILKNALPLKITIFVMEGHRVLFAFAVSTTFYRLWTCNRIFRTERLSGSIGMCQNGRGICQETATAGATDGADCRSHFYE